MIGTVENIHNFSGLTLTKVELCEFVLKLYFGDDNRLDIEEYWEYVDKDFKSIDKSCAAKFRKEFLLPRLVNHKLVSSYKESSYIDILFDTQERLLILVSDEIQEADLLTRYVVAYERSGWRSRMSVGDTGVN